MWANKNRKNRQKKARPVFEGVLNGAEGLRRLEVDTRKLIK
jgi:hypothetical protein